MAHFARFCAHLSIVSEIVEIVHFLPVTNLFLVEMRVVGSIPCMKTHIAATLLLNLSTLTIAQVPPAPDRGSAGDSAPQPLVFVENRNIELNSVLEGDTVPLSWRLENRGAADLIISRTAATCGCTVVSLSEEEKVIKPGGAIDLKAQFNSTGRFGDQNKAISVYSNDALTPELKLTFHAKVEMLYLADPSGGMVNLGLIRRGETSARSFDLRPASGHGPLAIKGLAVESGSAILAEHESVEEKGIKLERVKFSASETAALGPVTTSVMVRLTVGDLERERPVTVRGEIVGDLTWLPKVVDATRQASLPGKRLAPVTVASPDQRPFQIRGVDAGPWLTAEVEPAQRGKPGTEYSVTLTVKEDAEPGPFGATLRVLTDSLDQPVVEIPVFGIVSAKVLVEPPMILFRADGTAEGTHRRMRVRTEDATALRVLSRECDQPAIDIALDEKASSRYTHLQYFDLRLTKDLPVGTHDAMIHLTTDATGDRTIDVPVRIEVPASGG